MQRIACIGESARPWMTILSNINESLDVAPVQAICLTHPSISGVFNISCEWIRRLLCQSLELKGKLRGGESVCLRCSTCFGGDD